MLVFVDESGDTGFKYGLNSSAFYVVTAVLVPDSETALQVERLVADVRKELRLPPHFEFHFNKIKDAFRTHFLTTIATSPIKIFAVIIDKKKFEKQGYRDTIHLFEFAAGKLFDLLKPELRRAKIVVDGLKSKQSKQSFGSFLRKFLATAAQDCIWVKKIHFEESHRNDLLQVADMACGAINRAHGSHPAQMDFCRLIQNRIVEIGKI